MIEFDGTNHIRGRNHRHAAREDRSLAGATGADGIDAEVVVAHRVAVAERDGAGFPAAAIVAAGERAEGVEELMVRVGFPLRGLASAGDDDAGAILRAACADGDGGGEVHDAGDGAEHADAVMHESDELAHIRLSAQVEHAAQGRMMVAFCADLDEKDFAPEVIHHGLPSLGGPPFDGDIGLAPGGDNPIWHVRADDFSDLRRPRFFQRMQMDVALEKRGANPHAEPGGEMLRKAMDDVIRRGVALLDQCIVALDNFALIVVERGNVRMVQPQIVEGRAHIGDKPARMRAVQLADGGGEQHDVAQ